MPDYGCELELDTKKIELQPGLKRRGIADLFYLAAEHIVPGCTIEYVERQALNKTYLRIYIKPPRMPLYLQRTDDLRFDDR